MGLHPQVRGRTRRPRSTPCSIISSATRIRYYHDFVKPAKTYRPPTEHERTALEALAAELGKVAPGASGEELQNIVYAVGKAHAFEPLRAWFSALYEVLLGQSQGPRFGGFIELYGVENTRHADRAGAEGRAACALSPPRRNRYGSSAGRFLISGVHASHISLRTLSPTSERHASSSPAT